MWWLKSFNDIELPKGNFATQLPRQFIQNRLPITGGVLGEYDLEGVPNRMGTQEYTYEFTSAECPESFNDIMDALLGSATRRGILRKTDGRQVRRATGRVANVNDATTIDDYASGTQRVQVQFACEPLWYADAATTVTFTSTRKVNLRATPNAGNARAIKYVVLTITSLISTSLTITIAPMAGGHYYNEFRYGSEAYGADNDYDGLSLVYGASTAATLVIDAGASTVSVGGSTDYFQYITIPATQTVLLWLEPGDSEINFSQAVSGSLVFRSAWV